MPRSQIHRHREQIGGWQGLESGVEKVEWGGTASWVCGSLLGAGGGGLKLLCNQITEHRACTKHSRVVYLSVSPC